MAHYIAIVEDAGQERAVGLWFPDLPGCFSAGDDVDEALRNAEEAVALYADALATEGRVLPRARTLAELRGDAALASELQRHMVALVPYRPERVEAA
ncbi:HicB family protein [Ancylobacter aquaticus]|nr:HicB family protein [Ancylobacter aquaticus]